MTSITVDGARRRTQAAARTSISRPPARHDTENVGVITKGELTLITGGEERRYGVGDWYHLGPGVEHAARFETETAEIEFWFDRTV